MSEIVRASTLPAVFFADIGPSKQEGLTLRVQVTVRLGALGQISDAANGLLQAQEIGHTTHARIVLKFPRPEHPSQERTVLFKQERTVLFKKDEGAISSLDDVGPNENHILTLQHLVVARLDTISQTTSMIERLCEVGEIGQNARARLQRAVSSEIFNVDTRTVICGSGIKILLPLAEESLIDWRLGQGQ